MQARLLTAMCLTSAVLSAQELLQNGRFENGTTGWTIGGYACDPKVVSFDTNGAGASNAYSSLPGWQVVQTPELHTIEQTVPLVTSVTYEFRCDLASINTYTASNGDGGRIQVWAGTVSITSHAFGSIQGNGSQIKRTQLCVRFRPSASGSAPLRIGFSRTGLCGSNRTPRVHIDNVSLKVAAGATVCAPGERKVGTPVTFRIAGEPNAAFALFLGGKLLPSGVPIPGIQGPLELDPTALWLSVNGTLDGNGDAAFPVLAPATIAGLALYWQTFSATPAPHFTLGPAACLGFYQ